MPKEATITKEDFNTLLRKGDKRAFEAIYRLYCDKLLHIASSYLGSREDAEEVVHNIFLRLWGQMGNLQDISNINSYLFTLTKNHCLDVLRHRKVALKYAEQNKTIIQTQYINDSTASLLLENELQKQIIKGIDMLPEKCKKIFIESRFNGRTSKEIAEMYAISKRTVDNHIANGIRLMRRYLKDFTMMFF